jgi:fructokinase
MTSGMTNIMHTMDFRIGIDLGGTKTEIIALDRDGHERLRHRQPTPRNGDDVQDYEATLLMLCDMVRGAERELGLDAAAHASVGIGTPGAISAATGRIKNANSLCLNDRPLKQDLEARLGREVRIANDANCFALSEAVDGAGQGAGVVFGVIIGTGVGGGVVVNGKVVSGRNRIAGEWGHTPLPWMTPAEYPGPRCFCGHDGCIETFLSGPGLSRDYAARGGGAATGQEIVARAEAGEPAATAALEAYQDRLARALAMVSDILDPDVIVLGGGVSNISRIYDGLTARVGAYAFTDAYDTQILRNRHGDSGGVRGAAWLWRQSAT